MNNLAEKLPPLMSVPDYLAWPGDGRGTRFELVEGELRAMAPASTTHGIVLGNLSASLHGHLRSVRPGCRVVAQPGIRPHVRAEWNFRIPDLGVTCGPDLPGQTSVADPLLLIEILSPSNAQETRGNLAYYATLPSLREIVVVHSTRARVELLARGVNDHWPLDATMIEGLDGSLTLASVGLSVPLSDIYAGTYLTTGGAPA